MPSRLPLPLSATSKRYRSLLTRVLNQQKIVTFCLQASSSDAAAVAAFAHLVTASSLNHPAAQRELGLAFKYVHLFPH